MSPRTSGKDPREQVGKLRRIVTDHAFLEAVEAAGRDKAAMRGLRDDPKAWLRGRGRPIPDDIDVEVTEEDDRARVRLRAKTPSGDAFGFDLHTGGDPGTPGKAGRDRAKKVLGDIADAITSESMDAAIETAETDPEARAAFVADPRAYLAARGVELPEGVDVEASETGNPILCVYLCVTVFIFFKACGWACIAW